MKRFALLLILAGSLLAAPWDGVHGDLSVVTLVYPSAPLAPGIVLPKTTQILVKSTDETVSAYRVSLQMKDGAARSQTVDRLPRGYMSPAVFYGISQDDIAAVTITKLHDGSVTALN